MAVYLLNTLPSSLMELAEVYRVDVRRLRYDELSSANAYQDSMFGHVDEILLRMETEELIL